MEHACISKQIVYNDMQCREVVFKEQEKHKLKMKTRFGSQGIIQNVFLEKKTMFEKSSMAGEFPLHGKCLKFSFFFTSPEKKCFLLEMRGGLSNFFCF